MSAVQPLARGVPPPYQPREFRNLGNLDGLSREAIELHLDIYRGYVASVNQLIAGRASNMGRFTFEYNGMILHEQFFEQLSSAPSELPQNGKFAKALTESFPNVEAWKDELRELAATRGVGWVICARDETSNRIFNTWIDLHHLGLPARTNPVLVIDLWEHAWLDDYRSSGPKDYAEAVLARVDWQVVEKRCWSRRA